MGELQLIPEAASTFAPKHDLLYFVITALAVFFTTIVFTLLAVFAIRYRRGSLADRSRPVDHDMRIELVWSIIPLLLGLGIFAWAAKLYVEVYQQPPKNAKEVFVIGRQWMWHLQHMNGIRENNELHVPVGVPIKLTMISQDVIHAFYLPNMRIKRDVLPGRYTTVWFEPTKVGRYRLLCTEYCGTQHSLMGGWIYVMEKDDFQKWYATGGETAGSAGAGNTGGPSQGGGLEVAGAQLAQSQGCTNCHAGSGAIARGPSWVGIYNKPQPLTNGKSVVADDAYLRESILYPKAKIVKGYQAIMPPYQGLLSEDQVLQLVAYIKALGDPKGAAALQLQQASPIIGDRAGSVTGGNPADTRNIQDAYIQSGGPTDQAANPADTRNSQDQFIQSQRPGQSR